MAGTPGFEPGPTGLEPVVLAVTPHPCGVTGRSRTDIGWLTTSGSPVELRPRLAGAHGAEIASAGVEPARHSRMRAAGHRALLASMGREGVEPPQPKRLGYGQLVSPVTGLPVDA
jgi:hypothetical protein